MPRLFVPLALNSLSFDSGEVPIAYIMVEIGDGHNRHLMEELDKECTNVIWGIGMSILCKITVRS